MNCKTGDVMQCVYTEWGLLFCIDIFDIDKNYKCGRVEVDIPKHRLSETIDIIKRVKEKTENLNEDEFIKFDRSDGNIIIDEFTGEELSMVLEIRV